MLSSNLVKKIGKGVGEYFLGIESYLSNRESISESLDILVGKSALTTLTVLGLSTIISGILYYNPLKYVFGIGTMSLIESYRQYINSLIKDELLNIQK